MDLESARILAAGAVAEAARAVAEAEAAEAAEQQHQAREEQRLFDEVCRAMEQHVSQPHSVYHAFHTNFSPATPWHMRQAVARRLEAMGWVVEWEDYHQACDGCEGGVAACPSDYCKRDFYVDSSQWLQ